MERFATLWGVHGEFGTTYVSKPVFLKTLVYFQRAHPPFVFYFTATFISFSYCLYIGTCRTSLEISSSTFAGRWPYLMALYRDL